MTYVSENNELFGARLVSSQLSQGVEHKAVSAEISGPPRVKAANLRNSRIPLSQQVTVSYSLTLYGLFILITCHRRK